MVSAIDRAKRALIALVKTLAAVYNVVINLNRDSPDSAVRTAYRKVSRRAHPDHGGRADDQKHLNAAHDLWQDALRNAKRPNPKPDEPASADGAYAPLGVPRPQTQSSFRTGFRIQGKGALFTYQKFHNIGIWASFVEFVRSHVRAWSVKYWCVTMETNKDGTYHFHMMLQFYKACDRCSETFAFRRYRPNVQSNDLLGEGWCGKRLQESLDRAFFYVFANKEGTVRDSAGGLCVAGNYQPAWTNIDFTYVVKGQWLDKLFRAYKLSTAVYEEYIYLARDGVPTRKRNLDAIVERQIEQALRHDIAERTTRIRGNADIYQPFQRVAEADLWLSLFLKDALRYPVLVVHALSYMGKTEWANSLFKRPLELKVGTLPHFPEGMRRFCKSQFDGVVLDDVRDMKFLVEHQEKLQGKYNAAIEFSSTQGGTCAYFRDLFRVPIVVTVNNSTRNLDYLGTDDFLSKAENVRLLAFVGRPGESAVTTSWAALWERMRG
jgi:hypothetical protein